VEILVNLQTKRELRWGMAGALLHMIAVSVFTSARLVAPGTGEYWFGVVDTLLTWPLTELLERHYFQEVFGLPLASVLWQHGLEISAAAEATVWILRIGYGSLIYFALGVLACAGFVTPSGKGSLRSK
jgi:hypothetical protein